jgi:hypothetical protein
MAGLGVTLPETAAFLVSPVQTTLYELTASTPNCSDVSSGLCLAPPRPGATIQTAQQACQLAKGNWDPTNNGCVLNLGPELPGYCGWVPFATSLFSECALPDAAALSAYGNYSVYQTGQLPPTATVPDPMQAAADNAAANDASSAALITSQDCSYLAGQTWPTLSQIVGPGLTAALTNPLGTGCQSSFPGWILYVGLAAVVWMALKR